MHHELPLLINIAAALVAAFIGGLIARRIGLPPIVGYLLGGVAIGPFTPGYDVTDMESISQLSELGVIFLMFGVGLHFSLRDLWAVRAIAVPGALFQITAATIAAVLLTQLWGWTLPAGIILGLSISVASTVVLLRGLMDQGLLNTEQGRVAVGWLVLEDLATVLILVLLPAIFGTEGGNQLQTLGLALFKAALFVVMMLLVGARFLPWLFMRIAFTRSRELFLLAVVAVALGTALGASELFGVSLALGAFLAGVVLGESDLSHQIGEEVLPFQDIFSVIFFVSVGMLVNPAVLLANVGQVVALTLLIIVGKAVLTILSGLVLPSSGRTILVVAAGLSQIGEFSFIVGSAGVALGVLTSDQYSLILAGAVFSIMANPLMFRLIPTVERALQRVPALWRRLDGHQEIAQPDQHGLADHVVVVGYGRVGEHIVNVLERLNIPRLVVENDARRATEFRERGVPTLLGDAANSEVLTHAELAHARALVVTVPEEAASEIVVAAARAIAPNLPIIARASTRDGIERLTELGARDVIHPELEGGLEVVRHTLLALGYPSSQVNPYTDAVRRDQYDISISTPAEQGFLDQLVDAVRGMEIVWYHLDPTSSLIGRTLAETNLRAQTGASVIALIRQHRAIANPKSSLHFEAGDTIGLLGDAEQVATAERFLAGTAPAHLATV